MKIRFGAFELSKRGAARFDLRDPYYLAVSLSWPGFIAAAIGAELGINLVFALLYLARPGCVANTRPGAFTDAFFFSVETLATVGYGVMAPATLYGHVVSAVEILCGIACTAMLTGLLFVRFSRPKARILYADRAVITRHDGHPTLMLRIGNGRMAVLTQARAKLDVLLLEPDAEGRFLRRFHNLPLRRGDLPLFALTWTIMHRIDADSPLHGLTSDDLRRRGARLFLALKARDRALGAALRDMKDYGAEDVVFGQRFAEAVSMDAAGRTVADLTRISLLEPEASAG